jgi:hypothetical protein
MRGDHPQFSFDAFLYTSIADLIIYVSKRYNGEVKSKETHQESVLILKK